MSGTLRLARVSLAVAILAIAAAPFRVDAQLVDRLKRVAKDAGKPVVFTDDNGNVIEDNEGTLSATRRPRRPRSNSPAMALGKPLRGSPVLLHRTRAASQLRVARKIVASCRVPANFLVFRAARVRDRPRFPHPSADSPTEKS